MFSELGSLLRYAYTNKAGPDPSALKFFWKANEVELEALGDDGFEGLLRACTDPRYRVALLLAHDAGFRIGEIRGMRWSDVEEASGKYGRLHIRRQIDTLNNITSTKGKRKRVVPLLMGGELHNALKYLMPAERANWSGGGYLITRTKDGRGQKEDGTEPLSYSTMREEVYRLYEVSNVTRPRLQWHSMRHSYCTKLANSGAPVHHVMKMAGHKSIETTLK